MNKLIITIIVLPIIALIGCSERKPADNILPKRLENYTNATYELYPTNNMWNYIKLNTRNGKMTMVQYSIEDDKNRLQYPLSEKALVAAEQEVNGRFKLEQTKNIYNFILLDQIDGRAWQVQWSFDADKCFVIPIE